MKKDDKIEQMFAGGGIEYDKSSCSTFFKEKYWYREKIVEMVNHIENERFLKAIYISMSDYLKENEPD